MFFFVYLLEKSRSVCKHCASSLSLYRRNE